MIEQFRNIKLDGRIKIKYTDNTGNKNLWQYSQTMLLTKIQTIVNTYMDQGITLTNRQLYYQLVANDIIPNSQETYKRICTFLTDARYGGYIDWEAIEDRGRVPKKHPEWDNVKELVESAVHSYRLPRWKDQEYYVELYCEKQAMESILKPIADKYHIYFGYNKGYSSASTMYDLAQRIKEQINNDKKCVILYLGDHDPSGLDMVRDIRERISEFLTEGDESVEPNFTIEPLALNMKQIAQYNPPPNPAKITDPRAKGYIEEFGNISWELDSLKPEVLIRITEIGIKEHLDQDLYEEIIMREKREIQKLRKYAESLTKEKEE
jgi:hypothetical protein